MYTASSRISPPKKVAPESDPACGFNFFFPGNAGYRGTNSNTP
jgi:hypothetical protein